MSRYRHWWRPNVERCIRKYPALVDAKNELQNQSITANYSAMPRSGHVSRNTEQSATRQLSDREETIIYAVEAAINEIGRQRDGREVIRLIELVYFSGRYTVEGAAMKMYMHRNTATARIARFVDCVGKYMGY